MRSQHLFLFFITAFGVGDQTHALNSSSAEVLLNTDFKTEAEFKKLIQEVESTIENTKALVRQRSLVVHRLKQNVDGPRYLWEEENSARAPRQAVLKYSEIELKSLLKQIEVLGQKKEEMMGDLELLKLRDEELSAPKFKSSNKKLANPASEKFMCSQLFAEPDKEKLVINNPFGMHKDQETGLSWKNTGWWVSGIKEKVRACAAGTVIFVGKITGRGRVMLLDHGNDIMTLYANMSDEDSSNLTKGERVEAGATLGSVGEKLFFEIRRQGEAMDPKLVLLPAMVGRFQF